MDEISDEHLMAFCDGELPPEERQRVVIYLAEHPEAALRLGRFEETGRKLRTLLPDYTDEPIPQRILDVLKAAPASDRNLTEPARASYNLLSRYLRTLQEGLLSWPPAAAMVGASLLVGTAVGWSLHSAPHPASSAPFGDIDRAGLAASAPLQHVLDTTIGSRLVPLNPSSGNDFARIVLSFVAKDGRICRQFEVHQTDRAAMSGVACRQAEQNWHVQILAQGAARTRPALNSSPAGMHEAPATVDAYVTEQMSGVALGEEDERKLINRKWRIGN